jgi:hypothetical protein
LHSLPSFAHFELPTSWFEDLLERFGGTTNQ